MLTAYHQPIGLDRPKRGDILQTNIGTRRERTFLILSARNLPTRWCKEMGIKAQRTKVWAERWWDLEPGTRLMLHRSSERNGGQLVHDSKRFPAKRKPSFEQLVPHHFHQHPKH